MLNDRKFLKTAFNANANGTVYFIRKISDSSFVKHDIETLQQSEMIAGFQWNRKAYFIKDFKQKSILVNETHLMYEI